MRHLPLRFTTASVVSTDTPPPPASPPKKTEEKERQQKKAKYANIKQRKVKACTKLSDNLYSVSSAEQAHKLIEDFKTRNTIKFSCNKASKGFGGTGE